jgi:hypothetical protein
MRKKIAVSVLLLTLLATVVALGPARAYVAGAADSIITLANGSVSSPALSFESSKGTGLYYGGSNSMVFASNKSAKATVGSAGLTMSAGANLALDTGTASATAGAATLNKQSGTITSEAITTAAGSSYTLTLTNSVVAATSRVFASVANGTNTQGELTVTSITPGSGSVVILVKNSHASQALNGTIKVAFFVAP